MNDVPSETKRLLSVKRIALSATKGRRPLSPSLSVASYGEMIPAATYRASCAQPPHRLPPLPQAQQPPQGEPRRPLQGDWRFAKSLHCRWHFRLRRLHWSHRRNRCWRIRYPNLRQSRNQSRSRHSIRCQNRYRSQLLHCCRNPFPNRFQNRCRNQVPYRHQSPIRRQHFLRKRCTHRFLGSLPFRPLTRPE